MQPVTNPESYRDPAHPIADGPFAPNWQSLKAGYTAPDWFRDAKFGIWAHWSAQCVPEAGDWYARQMYIQGDPAYTHHLKTYGHPADGGFMEMENRWKAENWDPEDLLDLYQSVGAKYFVALANHHDNFDAFASRHHQWNSTRVGPKKDIVGIWAMHARARGLKFGVSNHSAHSWHWYQTAYGYDPEGPRAGERYDAWKIDRHDGAGKWWDGLDPQELYTGACMPMPDGIDTIAAAATWHEENDRVWNEDPPINNPAFVRQWYRRCKDLIDSYKPDLLYFDNFDLPLGQAGLDIAAHYYNSSLRWHVGQLQGVITTKELAEDRRGGVVEDVERGYRSDIEPVAWQTDTCIGHWHYDRSLFDNKTYMSAAAVVHRLCDVVAKNGNLLLSIPLRGDGTIDAEERRILEEVGSWLQRFGDAIFSTRPWRIAGEGPTRVTSGQFGEEATKPFTAQDIRFTTRDGALYATSLGRADKTFSIATLAESSAMGRGVVHRVEVTGQSAALDFARDQKGLHIALPENASHPFGVSVKITGEGLM